MEDNFIFEVLVHLMEFSVVVGIIVVTWIVKKYPTQNHNDENKNNEDHSINNNP